MTDRTLVLYHANCADGFCAAWVWWHYVSKDAEFVPVQYGADPPNVAGRTVVILDFSYKRPVLEQMRKEAVSLYVIDHHETAQAELEGMDNCVFDMDKSGAHLTFSYLFSESEPLPWLVRYTEDRDLWRWALPQSKAVSAALTVEPRTFERWDELHEEGFQSLAAKGAGIVDYQQSVIDAVVGRTEQYEAVIGEYCVPCVNCTGLVSEIVGALSEGRPFAAGFFIIDHQKVVYSLRSREGGVNVADIARAYGGGGHARAAGFVSDHVLPMYPREGQ